MPVAIPTTPELTGLSYSYVPETKENLEWAELVTVDLSVVGTSKGKKEQAQVLINALRNKGFFYVKGFNISQEKVDRQFAIGNAFYGLPLEEKLKYTPDLDNGAYNGYRPAGRRVIDEASGIVDRTEVYNIPKFNGQFPQEHPKPVADHIEEVEEFARSLHTEVLNPLFTLLAIALELPEDYFVKLHQYEEKSEDHLRYMKYSKYTPEENAKIRLWSRGHTDLGTLTLLFRQPVAALQIKDHSDGQWRWVKPQPSSLTVNACDALTFLTGNYVKSTIHRVASPPKDQQHVDRLGLLYFSRPHNDLRLSTIQDSSVLKRDGYTQNDFEAAGQHVPTMEEWTFAKQKWQQSVGSYREKENAVILPGFHGKYFE